MSSCVSQRRTLCHAVNENQAPTVGRLAEECVRLTNETRRHTQSGQNVSAVGLVFAILRAALRSPQLRMCRAVQPPWCH